MLAEGRIPFADHIFKDIPDYGIAIDAGAFFIGYDEFFLTFSSFSVAEVREGYSSTWYDKENYKYNQNVYYETTVPRVDGDLIFMVHSYYKGTIPKKCTDGEATPEVTITVTKGVYPDKLGTNTDFDPVATLTY